jgi:hypothetical protein
MFGKNALEVYFKQLLRRSKMKIAKTTALALTLFAAPGFSVFAQTGSGSGSSNGSTGASGMSSGTNSMSRSGGEMSTAKHSSSMKSMRKMNDKSQMNGSMNSMKTKTNNDCTDKGQIASGHAQRC